MSLEQKMADFFKFEENDTNMKGEIRAGVTTFLTMAYILLVNPSMLAQTGIPFNDALFATARNHALGDHRWHGLRLLARMVRRCV